MKQLSVRLLVIAFLLPLSACDTGDREKQMRNRIPPAFDPHRAAFTCVHRDAVAPKTDPKAETLIRQAMVLEWQIDSPEQRDGQGEPWPQIIKLNQEAAALGSWKARLNLVNLRLEGRLGRLIDSEVVVSEVEAEMARGVPDAYDMMGDLYGRGIGVKANGSKAMAFHQKAADMGSPGAQTYLGEMLDATYDNPEAGFYGNMEIGRSMLECAFRQGYGKAAYELGTSIASVSDNDPAGKAKALKILHEGVKMGCSECADKLSVSFNHPTSPGSVAPGPEDKARAKRYARLGDVLGYNNSPEREMIIVTLPNLDKVLPLPPAKLPPWNGDVDRLIETARGRANTDVGPN